MLTHRRLLAALLALLAVVLGLHAARPPAPATAALLVADHDLPAGTVLTSADLATVRVPVGLVPAGAEPHAAGLTFDAIAAEAIRYA